MNAKILKSNLSKCDAPQRCFHKLTPKYKNRNKSKVFGYALNIPSSIIPGWNLPDMMLEIIYDPQTDLLVVGPVSKIEKFLAEE
jgi:hypothetical protein